jgi:hypothetical protein
MNGFLKWVIFLALLPAALWALFWIFMIGVGLFLGIFS